MFVFWPLGVKEPNGVARVPWANALLIIVNVLVFFVNSYLDWPLAVGRGAGLLSIVTYGFAHADPLHLIANMWFLWLFGNPVNRRLGNGYYLLSYLGTIVGLGFFAWLMSDNGLVGASGGIFAVMLLFMMLMPRAVVQVGYVALFPFTLLVGLFSRPKNAVYWFLRWDAFECHAWIGFVLITFLEVWSLWSGLWAGHWNWTNLAHLFGVFCGVAIILLLPPAITMRRPLRASSVSKKLFQES